MFRLLAFAVVAGVTAFPVIEHRNVCAQSPPVPSAGDESKLVAALEAAGGENIRLNAAGLVEAVTFQGDNVPLSVFDLLPQLKGLTELRIISSAVAQDGEFPSSANDETVAKLSGLRNLKLLDLHGSWNLTNAGLKHLATLDGLNELILARVAATDDGVVHLASLTALTKLTLAGDAITGEGLAHLDKLTGLEQLALGQPITNEALRHLVLFPKLQSLRLTFTSIGDTGLAHVGQVSSLRELNLFYCFHVTDIGLSHLAGLKNLERLNLSSLGNISDDGLAHVGKIASLKELNLAGTPVGDAGMKHLQNLTALEELLIGSTKVTDAGMMYLPSNLRKLRGLPRGVQSFEHLGHLTKLEVLSGPIDGDPGIENLKSDELRVLGLGYWDVTDSDLPQFERFPKLESIYFGSDEITDAGLPSLVKLRNLEFLNLEDAKISDAGLLQLAALTKLRQLYLGYNSSVTEQGVTRLGELLPDCKIEFWRRTN